MPQSDELVSINEAAEIFGKHRRTVERWIARKLLPAHRVGGHWRIRRADVEAMILGIPVSPP